MNRAGGFISNLSGEMSYQSFRPAPLPPNPPIRLAMIFPFLLALTVAAYSQRWMIETFFKNYKQDLNDVSRYRARKYSVINANCAIAMIQYMVMAVVKRIQSDPRTLEELFVAILDEGDIETLSRTVDEMHRRLPGDSMWTKPNSEHKSMRLWNTVFRHSRSA